MSPGRSWAAAGRSAVTTTASTGYPPVTGWSARNRTGAPSGGTWIAPGTRPSLGSSASSARRSRGPAEPQADPVAGAADRPPRAAQRRHAVRGQPVPARAGQHAQHRLGPRGRRPGRRRRPARRRSAVPTGSRSPAASGAGPSPDSVSVLREPEHADDVEAAADREVGAQPDRPAVPARGRRPAREERAVHRHRPAVEPDVHQRTGDGHQETALGPDPEPAGGRPR